MAHAPGNIRDSIIGYLSALGGPATLAEICNAVASQIGGVAPSSVRSYLNLNTPEVFERTDRGRYRLNLTGSVDKRGGFPLEPAFAAGHAQFYHAD